VAEALAERLPNHPLVEELARTVESLTGLIAGVESTNSL
jgi:hypothetical protein